jgi:dihydroorotate dehydrogenase
MTTAYESLVRPLLFLLEPEQAHHLALAALRRGGDIDFVLHWLNRFAPRPAPRVVFGVQFPNPLGLAAGFDKNGVAIPAWAALGFGFVEIGTVTAQAQPGNPHPRIFRYPKQEALVNRLGFNNDGADVVADRLRRLRDSGRWPAIPVGINIGKTKVTPIAQAPQDYVYSFRLLHSLGDYVVLNVSSPNTPGLRDLQQGDSLSSLLQAVAAENTSGRPVLVKVSPDVTAGELDEIVGVCESHRVAAIIATNTTLDRSAVASAAGEQGGLSGAPLRQRSTEMIRTIRARSTIPIIGCGGIFDGQSAWEKFQAGADLLQIYTGLIYRGPGLIRQIVDALANKI